MIEEVGFSCSGVEIAFCIIGKEWRNHLPLYSEVVFDHTQ